jgi:hypothetical protein
VSILTCPTDGRENAAEKAPFLLTQKILARSFAETWAEAKLEWELDHVYFADADDPGTCLCGHFPIREHCVLHNRETGLSAVVGNVCVTKFLGIDSGSIFDGLNRVLADPTKALNLAAVDFAWRRGWVNDWERRFCTNTCRKHKLSPRQRQIRAAINTKVVGFVAASGREATHA